MLRSRPTVMGMTTPGNRTVFRKGSMGNSGGVVSAFICSSSSAVINGISSVSFSIWSLLKRLSVWRMSFIDKMGQDGSHKDTSPVTGVIQRVEHRAARGTRPRTVPQPHA
jgi:hypothetical protein